MIDTNITFDRMLDWFSPDQTVINYCDECGCPIESSDSRHRIVLCLDCRMERHRKSVNRSQRNTGHTLYEFDDPVVNLVYGVISQAMNDCAWQRKPPRDKEQLNLSECEARDFVRDGGVELWLRALGLGVTPSMRSFLKRECLDDG